MRLQFVGPLLLVLSLVCDDVPILCNVHSLKDCS